MKTLNRIVSHLRPLDWLIIISLIILSAVFLTAENRQTLSPHIFTACFMLLVVFLLWLRREWHFLHRQEIDKIQTAQKETHFGIQQVHANIALHSCLKPEIPLPALGGWAASPDFLLLLVNEIIRTRPALIVEAGSGTSTLVAAYAMKRHNIPGRIISLDHQQKYRDQTWQNIVDHKLEDWCEVIHAPLITHKPEIGPCIWYDTTRLQDIENIDMIIIDGPPEIPGERSRYPAIPLLKSQFADPVTIIIDDAARPSDASVADDWMATDLEGTKEMIELEKGALVLRGHSRT